mgnify:CR=1 FL=1
MVRIDGENYLKLGKDQRARFRLRHVGFVFQFYNLIPSLTAGENVALVTDIAEHPLAPTEALDLVNLTDRLDEISAPTWICYGENDAGPLDFSDIYQERIPNCTRTILPDSGHYPFWDSTDAFLAALDAFLLVCKQTGDDAGEGRVRVHFKARSVAVLQLRFRNALGPCGLGREQIHQHNSDLFRRELCRRRSGLRAERALQAKENRKRRRGRRAT